MKTMSFGCLAVLLAFSACGDDTAPGAPSGAAGAAGTTSDPAGSGGAAGAEASAGNTAGGGAGAPLDEAAVYRAAVTAAKWRVLANAPKVTGGAKQDDVFFLDVDHGFAVSGQAGAVYETKDGGESWTTVLEVAGSYPRSVIFTSPEHGFVGNLGVIEGAGTTDETVIYETKDGAKTWAPVTAIEGPKPGGICNFHAVDADHLVAVGRVSGPAFVLSSSDGGASWTSRDLSKKLSMLIDAHFSTPLEGVVVGGSLKLPMRCTALRTTDGGETWEEVFASDTTNSLCWKVQFPSANVGYIAVQDAGTGDPTFAKTTDGGVTWTELPLPGNVPYSGIGVGFVTDDIGWMAADTAKLPVYRTYDGGLTWEKDASLKGPINRLRFVDKYTGYAIGGSTWKLTLPRP